MINVDTIALKWLEQKERVQQEQAKLDEITNEIADLSEFSARDQNDYGRQIKVSGENYTVNLTRPTSTTWDQSKLKNLDYPEVIEYEPKVNKRKLQELDSESQDEINACSTVSIFNKDGSYKKPQIKIEPQEITEDIGSDI
tara:strand:+ start:303 stop:725 length:423 start_codon:yes stop_codon:yes gene_type:complete